MLRYASQLKDTKCQGRKPPFSVYAAKTMPQQERNSKISVRTVSTTSRFESTYGFFFTYVFVIHGAFNERNGMSIGSSIRRHLTSKLQNQ